MLREKCLPLKIAIKAVTNLSAYLPRWHGWVLGTYSGLKVIPANCHQIAIN